MKKYSLIRLAILFFTITTLSGCIWAVDDGYGRGGGGGRGEHGGGEHGGEHHDRR